jgi:hypothetical protein
MYPLAKNREIEILDGKPFDNDYLDRKTEITNLTNIVDSIGEPFVLSINGKWGSGKTTFIRLWKQDLENQNYLTFYFNAWENDATDDPLIALVGEIEEQISENNSNGESRKILNTIKDNAGKIISSSLPTLIKVASHGLLDIKGDVSIEKAISDYLSNLPNEYIKFKKERESLRKSLTKFSKVISKKKDGKSNGKIVFFIDDLDRCRPTFAINLLEKIKHIFNLTGYVFVLALDKEQIGYSLQTLYGNKMDTEGYLKRFIDFNYNLDTSKNLNFLPLLFKNMGYEGLFESSHIASHKEKFFMEMLKAYCKSFSLSLRDIEQLFFHLKIILPHINCEVLYNLYAVPLLLVLRIKYYEIYLDYITNKNLSILPLKYPSTSLSTK